MEPISILSVTRVSNTVNSESFPNEINSWSISAACTAVKIVDLIQSIRHCRQSTEVITVAIVISAWDVVEKIQNKINPQLPEQWLRDRLPLLDQYLNANPELLRHAVFGISAIGGDFENDLKKLQKISYPSKRIKVHFNGNVSNDITLPIKWLMNLESVSKTIES